MSGSSDQTSAIDALALLPRPGLSELSEEQVRGAACIWCGTRLSAHTAVNLGEERVRLLDGAITMFPRSCRTCVADRAHQALLAHAPACEPCIDNAAECETGRALYRLIRENRR